MIETTSSGVYANGDGPNTGHVEVTGGDDGEIGVHIYSLSGEVEGEPVASAYVDPVQAGVMAQRLIEVATAELDNQGESDA